MAYVFVEIDKSLGSTHSGSSGSTRTTTSSSGVELRNWVKNVLIIGDPIAVLNSGEPDFLPTLAQMYLEGDPDVLESLRDWYPELKPVVENYISSGSTTTTTSSGSGTSHSGSTTTTTSSGSGTSHSGSSSTTTSSGTSHSGSTTYGTNTSTGVHTQSSSAYVSSTGVDHTGAQATISADITPHSDNHSGSYTGSTRPTTKEDSTTLDELNNEYDEEAMRIYREAMAAGSEVPLSYNTTAAPTTTKKQNYWPYILGGVAAVGLIYLLLGKKKNDKK